MAKVATKKTGKPQARKPQVRKPKVPYDGPVQRNADGKFDAVPEGYSSKKHKPLLKADFVDDALWYLMKAAEYDRKAQWFRDQADQSKKLGGSKDKAAAKKLLKMQERFAELRKNLESQGIDVAALLGATSEDDDETSDETETELAGAEA